MMYKPVPPDPRIVALEAERDRYLIISVRVEKAKIELEAQNARLKSALERVLLDIDFMIEGNIIPDIRSDIIYVAARAAAAATVILKD